jgi:crotonobetaine/carnitine-CoA ligase
LRIALSPATPPEHVHAFRKRFGVELVEGYGSTETSMIMCNRRGGDLRPGTMGWVVDGFEVMVVDDGDCPLPAGVPGELVVRASEPFSMASGYFQMPEKTVEAWRNLWFHTGDRVVCDEEGVFRFLDRMKDSIRRRGENISSHEVEQALLTHPDVESCAAIPVPSELGEDEVMVFVVPRAATTVDPADLVEHCRPRLAYFAIPRFVEILDALPLTENGKIRKTVLRERCVSEQTWDREAHDLAGRDRAAGT